MSRPVTRIVYFVATVLLLTLDATVAVAKRATLAEKTRALGTAIRKNHGDTALRLIAEGANIETAWGRMDGQTAARLAAHIAWNLDAVYIDPPHPPQDWKTHLPAFRFLVRKSLVATGAAAIPHSTKNELLLDAARLGDGDSVRLLLGYGADIEARTPTKTGSDPKNGTYSIANESPLLLACGYIDHERDVDLPPPPDPYPVVAFLLKRGADPNAASAGGGTPLMTAIIHGKVGAVRALIAAGAKPVAGKRGTRPELAAARYLLPGKPRDTILALLASVTPRDLFEASGENDAARVQKLLRAGADPNAAPPNFRETADAGGETKRDGRGDGSTGWRRDRHPHEAGREERPAHRRRTIETWCEARCRRSERSDRPPPRRFRPVLLRRTRLGVSPEARLKPHPAR